MKSKNYAQLIIGAIFLSLLLLPAGYAENLSDEFSSDVFSDRDRDGVVDNIDFCPDNAAGVAVDEKGCPVFADQDLDGIIGTNDFCSNTPKNVVVDNTGCPRSEPLPAPAPTPEPAFVAAPAPAPVPVPEQVSEPEPVPVLVPAPAPPVVILPEPASTFNLEYLPNGNIVSADFDLEMQKVAAFINANSGQRFIIEGHTDSVGNDTDNMKLSTLRAEKIKAYLSEKLGIDAALLETRGFGENNPVAGNDTQEGRSQNRRVVIIAVPR